jgi:predicted Zn-dependent protease
MMAQTPSELDKFFVNSDLTQAKLQSLVTDALKDADYGEFYQQIYEDEAIYKDQGKYKIVSVGNGSSGFSVRVGQEERVGFASSADFNEASLVNCINKAKQVLRPQTASPTMRWTCKAK